MTTESRRNHLISEPPNYHTTKNFPKDLLAVEMKKNMNTHE